MVVAHPDDETLWGAGIILRNPGDWTVVACSTPMSDPVRAVKFEEALRRLGAKGRVSPYLETFSSRLPMDVDIDGFDVIVTHGANGEYGHPHHCQVSDHVRAHASCRVITFGFETGAEVLRLTAAEAASKAHALQAYDHVLPYDGRTLPKWQALLDRYGRHWLERETYDG
jgi:hypothetical protein